MKRPVKAGIGRQESPAGGSPLETAVILPAELVKRIDVWAGEHEVLTRGDAISKLVELGLAARQGRGAPAQQRDRAATLAARQLDQMGDASATSDEVASRKRRLTEGPSAFREVRHDRSKKKALK